MSRKSILLGFTIVLVLGGSVTAVLAALLRHEREFYKRVAPSPGPRDSTIRKRSRANSCG